MVDPKSRDSPHNFIRTKNETPPLERRRITTDKESKPMSTATLALIFPDDTARTRRKDKIQSHMAGDRSQATVKPTKRAVLLLVIQHGEQTGAALNDLYRAHRHGNNWGVIAFDTPRKRAEELEKDGYLAARYQTSEGNHLPEAVYSITDLGRSAVTA